MSIESKIKKDIPLAPYTTFQIGGSAKFFVEVKFGDDLEEAIAWAKKSGIDYFIIGGGSNVLIPDEGLNGLVIKFTNDDIANLTPRLHCGAGASLTSVLIASRANSLSGIEWSAGIPKATIGGSVRGNAGAFGKSMSDIIETVEAYNIKNKRFEFFSKNDCQFEYRSSIFKKDPNLLIWGATINLRSANLEEIKEKVSDNVNYRNERQPKLPSAGSVFKNLFLKDIRDVNEKLYLHIMDEKKGKGGKIGAGYMVDLAGLKGKKIGGAKVSLEHANFIVNTGRATANDVIELIKLIKKEVSMRFGIELEEEVQVMA
jgi:UDP-N-acetylmuramate dehydrogenase